MQMAVPSCKIWHAIPVYSVTRQSMCIGYSTIIVSDPYVLLKVGRILYGFGMNIPGLFVLFAADWQVASWPTVEVPANKTGI